MPCSTLVSVWLRGSSALRGVMVAKPIMVSWAAIRLISLLLEPGFTERQLSRRPIAQQLSSQANDCNCYPCRTSIRFSQAVQLNQLVVFVKAPRPGMVKTRLAAVLGEDAACAAYCRLVEKLLRQLTPLVGVELCFTPDDSEAEI